MEVVNLCVFYISVCDRRSEGLVQREGGGISVVKNEAGHEAFEDMGEIYGFQFS